MTQGGDQEFFEKLADTVQLGRVGPPRNVSAMVTVPLSDDASFITGAEITINGGRTAAPSKSYF